MLRMKESLLSLKEKQHDIGVLKFACKY